MTLLMLPFFVPRYELRISSGRWHHRQQVEVHSVGCATLAAAARDESGNPSNPLFFQGQEIKQKPFSIGCVHFGDWWLHMLSSWMIGFVREQK